MRNVDDQIQISNESICKLIDTYDEDERGFLSQNILDKLRTFVEAISVKVSGEDEYSYDIFQNNAKNYVSSKAELKFLREFHKFLQQTVSHYQPDEENSERLMLKYYEYLLKIKSLLKDKYDLDILESIDKFPITTDPALKEYHEKIVDRITLSENSRRKSTYKDRYYIRKIKPFFVNNKVYYEVTFTTAVDYVSKFDRVIAFTDLEIQSNYAVKLTITNDVIDVLGKQMPIQIIDSWEISIRPCELKNFAKIFDKKTPISSSGTLETYQLMKLLTSTGLNLIEVIELSDEYYKRFKDKVLGKTKVSHFFDVLDKCRKLIKGNKGGSNIVRYLLYKLNNKVIKNQYTTLENPRKLSNLNLKYGCIPFDEMPFNTSPIGHNPKIGDLIDSISPINRKHELLARHIKNNTERKGDLYTHRNDLNFDDLDALIQSYNDKLYYLHPHRRLEKYKEHVYVKGYEEDTFHIIEQLKALTSSGIKNYSNSIETWLKLHGHGVDCDEKKGILKKVFENSYVAMVYGSAGTGKTTLINHISSFHKDFNKLYLANTNPAVNNLRRRINASNTTFKTITSFLHDNTSDTEFDILFIDECSTVSNSDMIKVLKKTSFKLLVLVGDVFQIESILFGNWFAIARSFLPVTSVFELTKPYRTSNDKLLDLWNKVRNIDSDILEHITNNNYSIKLDDSVFDYSESDEIILCLNYDGLYGINNINRFLQGSNPSKAVQWNIHTYKVNDPILFNESNRFKPLIHNNLKGEIQDIKLFEDRIQFDIEIDKSINELDVDLFVQDLELIGDSEKGKSVIRFSVDKLMSTDEDEDSSSSVVPFQIAYAVSMHKAQGLEYSSVKVVITNETEEQITHNLFYTAITRTKEKLKIYWTPETEKKVLGNLEKKFNNKDVQLLKSKFNL